MIPSAVSFGVHHAEGRGLITDSNPKTIRTALEGSLRENLGAADVTLSAEEVATVDAALDGMDLMVFGGHATK